MPSHAFHFHYITVAEICHGFVMIIVMVSLLVIFVCIFREIIRQSVTSVSHLYSYIVRLKSLYWYL